MKLRMGAWRAPALPPKLSKGLAVAGPLAWRMIAVLRDWLMPSARTRILRPYTRPFGALRGAPLIAFLLLFCFVWGAAFAFMAPYLLMPLLVPLVLIGLLVLWALPEMDRPPVQILAGLFFSFIVVMGLWPDYLAPNLPGVPRVSLQRVLGVSFVLTLLICLSTSSSFRRRLSDVLRAGGAFSWLLCALLTIQLLSIGLSSSKGTTFNMYLSVLMSWIAVFVAGCYLLASPGRPTKMAAVVCIVAGGLSALGLLEAVLHRVPWAGHIPSFLQVEDPIVAAILAGNDRLGKGHRVQGPFHTPLAMSQYLALCVPFLLYFVTERFSRFARAAAACTIPVVILAIVVTQSRTGLLGVLVTFLLYPVLRVGIVWMRDKKNMVAASLIFGSPLAVVSGLGAALLIPGIRFRLLGGGAEKMSNEARHLQIQMGMPKILAHPWGYGFDEGAKILGYTGARGELTIDSFPLRLALEYGVLGFAIYYLMNAAIVGRSLKIVLFEKNNRREFMLLAPMAINVISFLLMQINFALDDNEPILYMTYALILALIYLQKQAQRAVP